MYNLFLKFLFMTSLNFLTLSLQANTLGEKIETEQLRTQLRTKQSQSTNATTQNFLINEESYPGGVKKEYITFDGVIFAVTWSGISHLDKNLVIGATYSVHMKNAVAKHQTFSSNERTFKKSAIKLSHQDLVYEVSGHMGSVSGRAYIKSLIPSFIDLNDIK